VGRRVGAWRKLAVLAVALVALSITFASVFVYYPVTATISPVPPPVKFEPGTNAGQADLSGTIGVSIGVDETSLTVTIHPTYQTAIYKNVSVIKNYDTKSYNVWIIVRTAANLPSGSNLSVCFVKSPYSRSTTNFPVPQYTGTMECVSLTATGTYSIGTLDAEEKWEVDVYSYIPEGASLPSTTEARIHLVYSPSSETPP